MADADLVERAKAELRRRRAQAELERRQAAPPEDKSFNYGFLPLHADNDGSLSLGVPRFVSDLYQGAKDAVTAPVRAYTGELPMTDTSGNTSMEAIAEALNMATMAGPSAVSLRAGERMIPGVGKNLVPAEEALSADAIKVAARDQYRAAREIGVDFDPSAVKGLTDEISQDLFSRGLVNETAPSTNALLKRLGDIPPAGADEVVSAPLTSLEAARQGFNNIRRKFSDPPDAEAARLARERLDQFLREPPEGAVVAGDAKAASQLYREADKNWAAAKKSDLLTGVEDAADLRAAAANSGQNAGNSTRQRIASVLLNQKTASRFSPEEREALESVVRGTPTENVSRYVANLLGGGGGLGQSLTALGTGGMAMAASGQPMAIAAGAIPAVAGVLLKKGSNYLTQRHLGKVEEAIRASAPASRQFSETLPQDVVRERAKEMVIRSLMAQQAKVAEQQFWDAYEQGSAF